jgi:hypothetical protein
VGPGWAKEGMSFHSLKSSVPSGSPINQSPLGKRQPGNVVLRCSLSRRISPIKGTHSLDRTPSRCPRRNPLRS